MHSWLWLCNDSEVRKSLNPVLAMVVSTFGVRNAAERGCGTVAWVMTPFTVTPPDMVEEMTRAIN